MTKKILLIIITVLFLVTIPLTIILVEQRQELRTKAAPASTLSFSPASLTAAVGQDFSLSAVIETQTNVVPAVELHISFNSAVFKASKLAPGAALPSIFDGPTIDNTAGTAYLVVANVQNPIQGSGTVATINFRVIGPSTQVERITFTSQTQAGAWQEEGANVLIGTIPASITIETATTPSPTTTPTPSTTPVPSTPTASPTPSPTSAPSSSTATATPTLTPTPTPGGAATTPVTGVGGPTFVLFGIGFLLLIWGLVAFL